MALVADVDCRPLLAAAIEAWKAGQPPVGWKGRDMNREEQLRLEHATLMAQYRAARDEIDGLLASSRQVVALTLTLMSLILAGAAFIEAKMPIMFLVAPLFLNGLAWTQLRHLLLMRQASAYIADRIAPRVRVLLEEMVDGESGGMEYILDWEEGWRGPGERRRRILLLPVVGATYGLPLFAALVFLLAYGLSVSQVTILEGMLIGVNVLVLLYSGAMGWLVEFRGFERVFEREPPPK
jgi:hypothetical protein